MLIWFGLRPVTRLLLPSPAEMESAESSVAPAMALPSGFAAAAMDGLGDSPMLLRAEEPADQFLAGLAERRDKGPHRQLQKLVDFDEEQAAAILRQWIREGASA